jgi:hypothetical protein
MSSISKITFKTGNFGEVEVYAEFQQVMGTTSISVWLNDQLVVSAMRLDGPYLEEETAWMRRHNL